MAKSPCDVLPVHLADNLASKDANGPGSDCGSHEWLGKPWGLWHPGSAHTWTPLLHWPPAAASVHPVGKLYGQQIQRPSGVSKDLPTRSRGTLGPRPRLVLDFLLAFSFPTTLTFGSRCVLSCGGLVSHACACSGCSDLLLVQASQAHALPEATSGSSHWVEPKLSSNALPKEIPIGIPFEGGDDFS